MLFPVCALTSLVTQASRFLTSKDTYSAHGSLFPRVTDSANIYSIQENSEGRNAAWRSLHAAGL